MDRPPQMYAGGGSTENASVAEIVALQQALTRVIASGAAGASTQRAFVAGNSGGTAPTTPNTGSAIIIAAAFLTSKLSGLFRVHFSVSCNAAAAAAGNTHALSIGTQTATGSIGLANNVAVGVGCNVSNAAAGITVTGGGGALVQNTQTFEIEASVASQWAFSWSGVVQNSITAAAVTRFPLGNVVLVTASLNSSANAPTLTQLSLDVEELA
jgi:hypothetical protein